MPTAMIVHAYYSRDARVRRYAEALARKGHEVDVICLRERGEPAFTSYDGVRVHRINLARRRGGKLAYMWEYLVSAAKMFVRLNVLHLSGRRYKVLHVHNMPNFLVFATAIQKWGGAKIVLDMHDPMPEVFQSKYRVGPGHWLARCLKLEERISCRFATRVIAANHAFKDIFVRRGCPEDKITVVMSAPDDAFLESGDDRPSRLPETRDFHILYVGTVAERYGLEFALKAVAEIRRRDAIPGLRFSIIPKLSDEGADLDRILAAVDALRLGDTFSLLQPVSHDQMPSIIASADVVIYTPMPDVHMDIALSLKIPEAIAVGRPVVASDLSVLRRYFGGDDLYLFAPGDIDACLGQLLEVYRDPETARKRTARARARLDQFAWPKQEQVYFDLLGQLVDGPIPQ